MRLASRLFLVGAIGHLALTYLLFGRGSDRFVSQYAPIQGYVPGLLASILMQPFWGPRAMLPLPAELLQAGRTLPAAAALSFIWGLVIALPFVVAHALTHRTARI